MPMLKVRWLIAAAWTSEGRAGWLSHGMKRTIRGVEWRELPGGRGESDRLLAENEREDELTGT